MNSKDSKYKNMNKNAIIKIDLTYTESAGEVSTFVL